MKRFAVPVIALCLLLFAGCYYDNEEALYPVYSNSCDTTSVTFSSTIVPILNNSCLSCHSDANAAFGGGIHLQKYTDVQTNSSKIIPAINGTGSKPMPPNGSLSVCSVEQFTIWVKRGMQEN